MAALETGVAPAGYRLPAETRPGSVSLQIADLERSIEFYERVLGFQVADRPSGGQPTARMGPAGGPSLLRLSERTGARPAPRRGALGLFHFAVLLPDRASLGRFVRHLADLGIAAGMSDHLVSEAIYLGDPDGHGIEVYADRPRETWRREAGQIAMATQPLDVRSVVEAGAGEAWSGAPGGTTLGHVHLHVGSIDVASDFYHTALGFDKVVWSYPGALFLSAGGYHHHLGVNTWAAGAGRPAEGDSRLLEWTLVLPSTEDAAAAAKSLTNTGYGARADGADWLADDPWGTTLRLTTAG